MLARAPDNAQVPPMHAAQVMRGAQPEQIRPPARSATRAVVDVVLMLGRTAASRYCALSTVTQKDFSAPRRRFPFAVSLPHTDVVCRDECQRLAGVDDAQSGLYDDQSGARDCVSDCAYGIFRSP